MAAPRGERARERGGRIARRTAVAIECDILPGIAISTKPDDYAAFKTLRIAVFDGASWSLSGEPMSTD